MAVKTGKFAFGGFRLDSANPLLWRGDDRVALAPKPFEQFALAVFLAVR